jgi:hypothetical protein
LGLADPAAATTAAGYWYTNNYYCSNNGGQVQGRYYNSASGSSGTTQAVSGSAYNGSATIVFLQIGEYQDGVEKGFQTFYPASTNSANLSVNFSALTKSGHTDDMFVNAYWSNGQSCFTSWLIGA